MKQNTLVISSCFHFSLVFPFSLFISIVACFFRVFDFCVFFIFSFCCSSFSFFFSRFVFFPFFSRPSRRQKRKNSWKVPVEKMTIFLCENSILGPPLSCFSFLSFLFFHVLFFSSKKCVFLFSCISFKYISLLAFVQMSFFFFFFSFQIHVIPSICIWV